MRTLFLATLLAVMGTAHGIADAAAAAPCTGFRWDVTKEQALFAGTATPLSAGIDATAAPAVAVDRLYELQLSPQSQVTFAAAPGKTTPADGAYAGIARLKLPAAGNYRVALDVGAWVDVVAHGKLAATRDFQGQHGCDAPHKIVEFDLSDATDFTLQVSGVGQATVRLTVTRAAAPTP